MDFKRARDEQDERDAKHSRTIEIQPHTGLKDARVPAKILALPHVVELLNAMLMAPEEAMMEAAATGQLERLKKLLDEWNCGFFRPSNAAVAASANGQLDVVKFLLPLIRTYREKAAHEIMEAAAARGHCDIIEAAYKWEFGNREGFHSTSYWYQQPKDPSGALSNAITGGHIDAVEYLLACYNWDIVNAIDQALSENQQAIAELILSESSSMDTLRWAVKYDNLNVVEFIHDDCDSKDVYDETAAAAAYGNLAMVKFFLEKNPRLLIDFYDPDDDPFVEAASRGHQEIVEFLYNKECISSESIREAFMSAARCGYQEIVELLYNEECIPSESIREAFTSATESGYQEVVEFLSNKGCISSEGISLASDDICT